MTTKRQTFKSRYGRKGIRVSDLCPTYSIRRRLGRTHVATPFEEVEAMVRDQVAIARARGVEGWTAKAEAEAVRFARWQHAENREEYAWVMGSH